MWGVGREKRPNKNIYLSCRSCQLLLCCCLNSVSSFGTWDLHLCRCLHGMSSVARARAALTWLHWTHERASSVRYYLYNARVVSLNVFSRYSHYNSRACIEDPRLHNAHVVTRCTSVALFLAPPGFRWWKYSELYQCIVCVFRVSVRVMFNWNCCSFWCASFLYCIIVMIIVMIFCYWVLIITQLI